MRTGVWITAIVIELIVYVAMRPLFFLGAVVIVGWLLVVVVRIAVDEARLLSVKRRALRLDGHVVTYAFDYVVRAGATECTCGWTSHRFPSITHRKDRGPLRNSWQAALVHVDAQVPER